MDEVSFKNQLSLLWFELFFKKAFRCPDELMEDVLLEIVSSPALSGPLATLDNIQLAG